MVLPISPPFSQLNLYKAKSSPPATKNPLSGCSEADNTLALVEKVLTS